MVLYKDNPKLELKIVKTISGNSEYRRNCKYIKGSYYAVDEDCFFLGGKWYRKESDKIDLDYEKNVWVLKTDNKLINGIVGYEKGAPKMGYFSPNRYNNVLASIPLNGGNSLVNVINANVLAKGEFVEDISTGTFYPKSDLHYTAIKKFTTIRNEFQFGNKGYNIEDNIGEFDEKKIMYKEYPTDISKIARMYGRFLGDITYGIEIETSEGNIPEHLQYRLGLVACKDGSINQQYTSAEWVSVPMEGAKGLQNIANIGEEVSKRCNVDINCSYHIHIGNIPVDRSYIVALYMLGYQIQDEIFKMFPYYKTDHRDVKKKNYCQKLKKMAIHPIIDTSKIGYKEYIDDVYGRIFFFLSDGVIPDSANNRRRKKHPIHHKWERKSR